MIPLILPWLVLVDNDLGVNDAPRSCPTKPLFAYQHFFTLPLIYLESIGSNPSNSPKKITMKRGMQ